MFDKNKIYLLKIVFFRALSLVLLFILPLVACPVKGQVVQKKNLQPSEYPLWGQLLIDKVSPDEKWVSYKMEYPTGKDTLFLRNAKDLKTFSFPSGANSLFTKDNFFIVRRDKELEILDPQTGRKESILGADKYIYSDQANLLLISIREENKADRLVIKIPLGRTLLEVHDIGHFSLSPDGSKIIYAVHSNGKNSVFLADAAKISTSKWLSNSSDLKYESFSWQKDAKAVAFYGKSKNGKISSIFLYTLADGKLIEFDPGRQSSFPADFSISDEALNPIIISDNLEKVFFTIRGNKKTEPDNGGSNVEIWNANDKWVYTQEQSYGKFETGKKRCFWQTDLGNFTQITSPELPHVMLTRDHQYAVLSNPKQYEPQFEESAGPRDYYILNLQTNEKYSFLIKQQSNLQGMYSSPAGRYISYFRDMNWWIYDLVRKTHTNITSKIGVPFYGKVNLLAADYAYGNPGWTADENEILLYDQFDLWAVRVDGSASRRLTKGRESKIRFRLQLRSYNSSSSKNSVYDYPLNGRFDLNDELFLRAVGDDGKTGCFSWRKDKGVKPIIYGDSLIDDISFGNKKQNIFCIEQRFDLPPQLIFKEKSAPLKTIFKSNPHASKYNWGKSELVRFQNSKKQDLKGILYYPANYDPAKKYPMIVHIYEIQSFDLHRYSNPTFSVESGYNPTLFSCEGYFVFSPDIIHEKGNVGPSTLDCVLSGTSKIIDMGIIDPKKIGIMGHSFGGYETVFIINHTNMFATAIGSGAIVDLTRRFLTLGANTRKPEMWRFGSGGWRLGTKTPFSERPDFDRNSPLESIENLQIPLLMWCGKEDTQVDPFQSMEYYLALRRLGKKCIFLQYPKEGHTLLDPINQKDLSTRILQWYGYYLKDEKKAEWIAKGTI